VKTNTRDAGYTLVELLISTAIMLVVTGAIFSIVNPARDTSQVQPEMSDQQQRLRVGAEMLYKDLVMAGAGVYQGASSGSLMKYFAPIQPYRTGRVDPDPAKGIFYRPDAISMVYVPNTAAQTTIRVKMPQPSAEIKVNAQPNCPVGDTLCGFKNDMSLLIFDDTGTWDSFEVTNVQDEALHLQHRGQVFNKAYDEGANIVQADWHTYYLNAATNQLMHYDGLTTETPVVDNVVGLLFTYFGTPNPPTEPKPVIGVENCVVGADGKPKLDVLPGDSESLVELDPAILTDGGVGVVTWCGANANVFDPDLYRIRKVRVTLRMQVGLASLRGSDTVLFRKPGLAKVGDRFVPDYEMVFDVTPRNLNLTR
jgi:prepilin-type N-terminal cleavage/methylation domain-containing protein